MSFRKVYILLLLLLALTVGLAYVPLGAFSKPICILIALTKASLVMYFFMDLRESKTLTRIFACTGILFLGILFFITFADYLGRGLAGVLGK